MLYLPLSLRLRGGGGTRDGKRRAPSSGTGSAKKKHKAAAAREPIPLRVDDDSDQDDEYVPTDREGDDSSDDDLEPVADDTGDDGTQVGEDSEEAEDDVEEDNPVAGDAGAGAAAGPDAAAAARAARRVPAAALLAELKAARKQNRQLNRTVVALAAQHAVAAARAPGLAPAPGAPAVARGAPGQPVPIEMFGQPGGRFEKGFSNTRRSVLSRSVQTQFVHYLGNTGKDYDVRQCAEDACTALGFLDPGDVATMMARMKSALKGLARDVVSHVAVMAREQYIVVHPDLKERVPKNHFQYAERLKENVDTFRPLIAVAGGPGGGFNINGADKNHWAFCSYVREGKLYFANSIFIKWQADFLNLMPSTCRRWTLYNLSWALLALKATLSMTRTINNGAVVWEYPRFEKQACASAEMLCELQAWLVDEWACLTEWPVLLDLRAQQQAV